MVSMKAENESPHGLQTVIYRPSLASRVLEYGLRCFGIPRRRVFYRYRFPSVFNMLRLIKRNSINLIYMRRENKITLRLARIVSQLSGVPLITYRQEILDSDKSYDSSSVYPLIRRINYSGRKVFPSNYIPLCVDSKRGIGIPHCVPYDHRADAPLKLVSVGKIVDRKGHQLLIEAAAQLKRKLALQISIYGCYGQADATRQLRQLEDMVKAQGLDDVVRFMPFVDPERMTSELAKHHVFVYAGWVNPQPDPTELSWARANGFSGTRLYSLLEAMNAGLPVICSAEKHVVGAVHHDHNGLVFQKGVTEDLAEQILRISGMDISSMGMYSRWLIREFYDTSNFVVRFDNFLEHSVPHVGALVKERRQ